MQYVFCHYFKLFPNLIEKKGSNSTPFIFPFLENVLFRFYYNLCNFNFTNEISFAHCIFYFHGQFFNKLNFKSFHVNFKCICDSSWWKINMCKFEGLIREY